MHTRHFPVSRHLLAVAILAALPIVASAQTLQGFTVQPAPAPSEVQKSEMLRIAEQPIVGRYIVVLKKSSAKLATEGKSAQPALTMVADDIAKTHGASVIHYYDHVLRGFAVQADDNALAALLADSRVAYVQEDGIVTGSPAQTNATWGLDRVDQRNLPLNNVYNYDGTASNVRAYVLDSGLNSTHQDFAGRVGNGVSFINDGLGTSDCHGHGTHVAGTLAGSTWGVAKGVVVHPVRVLDCGNSGSFSGVIAGINWVAANRTLPAVANMSLSSGANSSVDTAVNDLIGAGVTVVVAAGNNNAQSACNYSPARVPGVITVGSTDRNDARSSFSNVGSCLDIFAPGRDIVSASNLTAGGTNTLSGTSMASPHVAGAAALYLSGNPSATPAQVALALNNNATPNKVTDAGSGSPNRLLYIPNGSSTNLPFRPEFSGGWYNPDTSGQGQLIEVNANLGLVFGGWYTYDANGLSGAASQRWFTFQGNYSPTDTVRSFTVYRNTGGNFDAPPVTNAVAVGSVTLSFQSCTSARLQYQIDLDGQTRSGTIPLSRLDANPYCASGSTPTYSLSQGISPGINGAWYEPATSGQGMQMMALPFNGNQLFMAWYTYDVNGQSAPGATGQRWFTIQGTYTPGSRQAFNLPILRSTGGRFDTPPATPSPTQVGTASITFHTCTSATLSYSFYDGRSGQIPLSRLTGGYCAP